MLSLKFLKSWSANNLKGLLDANGLLSHQSGFQKQHSTITAAIKVVNDIIEALDGRKYCAALFIDLSKAFDTVDHVILADRLHKIGLSDQAVNWFSNYLSGRTVCPGRWIFFLLPSCSKGCASRLHSRAIAVHNLCEQSL